MTWSNPLNTQNSQRFQRKQATAMTLALVGCGFGTRRFQRKQATAMT